LECGAGEGWRRMEKISWTDRVRNAEVIQRIKEEGNILKKVKCSRYRPGVAQRVGRGIALLFHNRSTRRG